MKIKNIERFCFVALLLMPFVFALCNSLWVLGDKTGSVSDFEYVFEKNLKNYMPDLANASPVYKSLDELVRFLVGGAGYSDTIAIVYIAYGINIFILWMCVDCFIALPLVLKRFIDRGVYRE